jgi:hypothetical protein
MNASLDFGGRIIWVKCVAEGLLKESYNVRSIIYLPEHRKFLVQLAHVSVLFFFSQQKGGFLFLFYSISRILLLVKWAKE